MIIKFFLIASLLAASLWLLRGERRGGRLAVARLAGAAFASSWVVAVLAPGAVTWTAHLMGVGRGTDLVLYVLVVAFMFTTLGQHQRLRDLDERLTRVTRRLALLEHTLERSETSFSRVED